MNEKGPIEEIKETFLILSRVLTMNRDKRKRSTGSGSMTALNSSVPGHTREIIFLNYFERFSK